MISGTFFADVGNDIDPVRDRLAVAVSAFHDITSDLNRMLLTPCVNFFLGRDIFVVRIDVYVKDRGRFR